MHSIVDLTWMLFKFLPELGEKSVKKDCRISKFIESLQIFRKICAYFKDYLNSEVWFVSSNPVLFLTIVSVDLAKFLTTIKLQKNKI